MTHLTVHEWGWVPLRDGAGDVAGTGFTRGQADALLKAARAHPLADTHGTNILVDRHTALVAQQMVGIIAAPGCSLEILPKIDPHDMESEAGIRGRLVHMLDVALGLSISDGGAESMARQSNSLLDILIRLFADRLLAEARRGLPRAYLAQEEDLPVLRGRLDVRRQFTVHAVRPDKLACRFDSLVADTPLLQVMKACVMLLRRHARSGETIRRLDELRFLLADVSDVAARNLPWSQVRIDRTSRRWEGLLGLARLFLKREWQATHRDAATDGGITLLFAMNDLFEAYITALARRAAAGTDCTIDAQGGGLCCLIDEGGGTRFKTRTDLLVRRAGEIAMIIDTKWKRIGLDPTDSKRGVSQADVYQMMAYARLYKCDEVMLLYPHHAGLGREPLRKRFTITGGQERLSLASVYLNGGDAAVVAQLAGLLGARTAVPA